MILGSNLSVIENVLGAYRKVTKQTLDIDAKKILNDLYIGWDCKYDLSSKISEFSGLRLYLRVLPEGFEPCLISGVSCNPKRESVLKADELKKKFDLELEKRFS